MAVLTLIAVTLACVACSLWIRRVTWSCRWEVAATLNVLLQGVAVLLMSPLASQHLGPVLHALTGHWNLEDYLGHDAYIVAASAVVYNVIGRLEDDHALQRAFTQYVERPATLCIPLMLATFSLSVGAQRYVDDFLTLPTDFWLAVYWVLTCAMLVYLLLFAARALLVVRRDPRSRTVADIYLVATVCGLLACAVRLGTVFVPSMQHYENGLFVWIFACACGSTFALASAHSWRVKTRWFSSKARR